MDAIEYLTDQHRQIESLFDQFDSASRMKPKLRLWRKLADLLAVHKAIEERIFFPAAREAGVSEQLLKSLVEHLSTERIVSELVEFDEVNDDLVTKMAVLRACKRQHAESEEKELFPRTRELLTSGRLEMLGLRMATVADQLMDFGVRQLRAAAIARA